MAHEHLETMLTETHGESGLARGLPAQAYTSEEFWQLECKTVRVFSDRHQPETLGTR